MAACTDLPPKVLLVEDEFLVSLHIASVLREAGFEIVGPAARLSDALRLARSAEITLAMLDVNMAGELSGPVARVLRERGVPFLFVTGYLEAHAQMPADLLGTTVLAKPADPDAILAALSRLVPN